MSIWIIALEIAVAVATAILTNSEDEGKQ